MNNYERILYEAFGEPLLDDQILSNDDSETDIMCNCGMMNPGINQSCGCGKK
jgi:hypothetical protein